MGKFNKKSVDVLTEPQLKALFKECDTNGDGVLSKAELKEAFRRLGSKNPSWRAERSIYFADMDGDGCIGEAELDHLIHYVAEQGYRLSK